LKDGEELIHHEIISAPKEEDIILRARFVVQEIVNKVDIYKPNFIGLESLSFSSRGDQTRNLGGLQFMIINELRYNLGKNVQVVNINTLKKFATGNGKADKNMMIESLPDHILDIAKTIPKTKGRDDFADAYHIARYIHEQNK
jgi:Holliday junction resolvasome RuvABC endonuclease subunit